ncbi:MAG: hypothetical protein ABR507_00265 [Actinomycetota bacterium]|nr:hypothetical protein [Actinomycetota bacterium]
MSDLEEIEGEIQSLSKEELAEFRARFAEYDWNEWDRRLCSRPLASLVAAMRPA